MRELSFSKYRCFYHEQHVRLAPLTILVGENSTGKTSFMALVRIIWFILKRRRTKNFDDSIFPLGGFTEISSRLKKKKNQELKFAVKVQLKVPQFLRESTSIFLEAKFSEHNQAPYPATFRIIDDKEIVEIRMCFDKTDKRLIPLSPQALHFVCRGA